MVAIWVALRPKKDKRAEIVATVIPPAQVAAVTNLWSEIKTIIKKAKRNIDLSSKFYFSLALSFLSSSMRAL
jgi:hypothetical protein